MKDTLELVRYAVRLAVDDGYRANEIKEAVQREFKDALKATPQRRHYAKRAA